MVSILKFLVILSLNLCGVYEVSWDNDTYDWGVEHLLTCGPVPHCVPALLDLVVRCLFSDTWCSSPCPASFPHQPRFSATPCPSKSLGVTQGMLVCAPRCISGKSKGVSGSTCHIWQNNWWVVLPTFNPAMNCIV